MIKKLKKQWQKRTKRIVNTLGNTFTFIQYDGTAMGLPLGPVLADIFMVELENMLVPTLTEYMKLWKRYLDDTISFVKMGSVEYIVSIFK